MLIQTNKEKLEELAKYFHTITNTLICIYDKEEHLICSCPNTFCSFCTEVRQNPALDCKCREVTKAAFEICKTTRKTHIYHCHMGLVEVATPIIYNDILLGYMVFGQVSSSAQMSRKAKVPLWSEEYIQAIAKLLEMCANYILLNSIISVRNEGLAFQIDLYLRENLTGDLSVPAICRQFGIGKSTLYEIFKSNFGCSLSERIQYYRNEAAKKLLKETSLSVSEISEAVGFHDSNYFIRFFKKQNGCTPKAYQLS